MLRVVLPLQLQSLDRPGREIEVKVVPPANLEAVVDALEVTYPMLRGTLRDQQTKQRRAFVRFFACGEDLSQGSPQDLLLENVAQRMEPLRVVGVMAGG